MAAASHTKDLEGHSDGSIREVLLARLKERYQLSTFSLSMLSSKLDRVFEEAERIDSSKADDTKPQSQYRILRRFLYNIAAKHRATCSPTQVGCPEILPDLRSIPLWFPLGSKEVKASDTDWLQGLRDAYPAIKREFEAVYSSKSGFQEYRAPSWSDGTDKHADGSKRGSSSGQWNVFYLDLHGVSDFVEENRKRCPHTWSVLSKVVPRGYGHALFSVLAPDTHIAPHHGPSNKKLRI